jgi:hypothetical protein
LPKKLTSKRFLSVFETFLAVKTEILAENRTFAARWQNFCGTVNTSKIRDSRFETGEKIQFLNRF